MKEKGGGYKEKEREFLKGKPIHYNTVHVRRLTLILDCE